MAPVLLNPSRFGGGGGGGGGGSYAAAVLADSPLVYCRMGDASGTTAADSSGNNRPGLYTNSPTLGASGATTDGDTAVTFNGTNQYLQFVSGGAADVALKAITGSFALECWAKPTSLTGSRGLFDRYGSGVSGISVYLLYLVSGVPRFIVRNTSEVDVTVIGGAALTANVWAHIAATYDGTNMRLYVNGVQSGSTLSATSPTHSRTIPLIVGEFVATATYFPGGLDELAVYPTALSGTRIAAHYAAA